MARSNPDLNFNKGVALLYEEDYPAALASFDRASALEPDWEKPQVYKRNLIKKLQQVTALVGPIIMLGNPHRFLILSCFSLD